jgi:phospholipase/carboxylesterase
MPDTHIIPADSTTPLAYRVITPDGDATNGPIIMLLHGMGSNENALLKLSSVFPSSSTIILLRAPYEMAPGKYSWYHAILAGGKPTIRFDEAERSRTLLFSFISGILKKLNRSSDKILVGGFSQGGVMTYNLGLTEPERFKGIFILGSRLQEEIRPLIKPSSALQHLPVFIGHGVEDQTLSLRYAQASVQYLRDLGIHPSYHEYPAGHTITTQMMVDLGGWIKELL